MERGISGTHRRVARSARCLLLSLAVVTTGCSGPGAKSTPSHELLDVADEALALIVETKPLAAYVAGTAKRHDGWPDISPTAVARRQAQEDRLLARVRALQGRALPDPRSANPDGVACWEAMCRDYSTLKRSADEVFAIGSAAVKRNRTEVIRLWDSIYGTSDFDEIVRRATNDPGERFASADEMREWFEQTVTTAREAMPKAFRSVPEQELIVETYPDNIAGTGVAASYVQLGTDRPAVFRYDPTTWRTTTRGQAERTALHEGYPGHHMQIGYTTALAYLHPIQRVLSNAAFEEGWARYAESLAEELGLFRTPAGRVLRRTWPARGMVIDAGLHVLGWSPEEVVDFIVESGAFDRARAEDMLDRIAAIPAQLTAYDSGALEILELRAKAENALGGAFDLRDFHEHVLDAGAIPLPLLRKRVETWIEAR